MPLSSGHIAGKESASDMVKMLEEHAHMSQNVYPTGATGVTVTGAAGAWTLGSFDEIIPASTITDDFDIHWVNIEGVSAADTYELVLYVEETEIARLRFTVTGTPANTILAKRKIQTPVLEANSQVQAKVMTAGGSSHTCTISLEYHTY